MTEPAHASRYLYLGPEFLTWVYFAVLGEGGIVADLDSIPATAGIGVENEGEGDGPQIQFAIGDRLKLAHAGPTATLNGAGLDNNGEILSAIRRGSFVESLALDFAVGHRVYRLALTSNGTITAKLPDLFSEPDEDDAAEAAPVDPLAPKAKKAKRPKLPTADLIELRVSVLDEVDAVVDALFGLFLARRLTAFEWQNDLKAIALSVYEGLRDRVPAGDAVVEEALAEKALAAFARQV